MILGKSDLLLLLTFCLLHISGCGANALSYDYTASIECLADPHEPQYGGGIIKNPELNQGLKRWSTFGKAEIEHRQSAGGNRFIVAHSRNQPYDSVSQKLYLLKDRLYTFSAWLQVSEGKAPVTAVFKMASGFQHAGAVVAESQCWSMLKGGITVDASGPAELFFESNDTSVEIWIDSVSLQPFTHEEWKSHQDESIEKIRKRRVRIQVVDEQGNPLPNTIISIEQNNPRLPFGCVSNKNILTIPKYKEWFTSRFPYTTFENEMKWYTNEPSPGKEDYTVADAMLQIMKQHNIAVRGHNILWDDPKYQPWWVKSLSPLNLALAAGRRIYNVINRYKGQVIAWDVINENLHNNFFESQMGENASAIFFQYAHKYDPQTLLFMNEFNTIESSRDQAVTPAKYLQKLREIQAYPGNLSKMAIGLEGHFKTPNLPYMRASIDTLSSTNLPIWLTEVDVDISKQQALFLEQVLREGHGHPKVNGIILWAGWSPQGCFRMCLTDNNFNNLPTGAVVDKLLHEWNTWALSEKTNSDGFIEASLFHGDYQVKIIDHRPPTRNVHNSTIVHNFRVVPAETDNTHTIMLLNISLS